MLNPLVARLNPALMSVPQAQLPPAADVDADAELAGAIRRARAEFLEMPGLKLSGVQAARIWAMEPGLCAAVLAALVVSGFLTMTRDGGFVRAS